MNALNLPERECPRAVLERIVVSQRAVQLAQAQAQDILALVGATLDLPGPIVSLDVERGVVIYQEPEAAGEPDLALVEDDDDAVRPS